MNPTEYSSKDLVELLEKSAFRRYHVNKLLKAHEKQGKYKNCTITCKDQVITLSNIKGKKDICIKLKTLEKNHHTAFLARARYALKSSKSKEQYKRRLNQLVNTHLTPLLKKSPFLNLADQDNAVAKYLLGMEYEKANDLNKAFSYYKRAADLGHKEAQYHTGKFLENGLGVGQDLKNAKKYYELAGAQNDTNALYALGNYYKKLDPVTATRYYQLAANYSHAPAQVALGKCYQKGSGVQKDEQKAAAYFAAAALISDYGPAQYELGKCYDLGIGLNPDSEMASKYYQLAAAQEIFSSV